MATSENMQAAFGGESQANRRYLAFARKASQDGLPQIARLFRAVAEAETVHALAHLRVMQGVRETGANLKEAIAGEAQEFQEMYPAFLAAAESDGHAAAASSFKNALAVEKIHHQLYSDALASLESGKDLEAQPIFVCSICGNTVYGDAPDVCPVCNAPRKQYREIF